MSNITLSSGSAKSSDLIYEEEENQDEQNSAKLDPSGSLKSKNTAFIEGFLNRYLHDSKTREETRRKQHGSTSKAIGVTQKKVTVLDFEIDRIEDSFVHSALSDIFSLKVRYQLTETPSFNHDEMNEKVSFFIVKVPPSKPEDRQLASLATVQQREILFYSTVVHDIQEWLEINNYSDINFAFAKCFYAKFNRPLDKRVVTGILENLSKAESIIVLQDLRPAGYGKIHYVQSLNIVEVKTALREIAKIHAVTWAIQETGDCQLSKKWNFYYRPEYVAMLYEALLETGFPKLEQYLRQLVDSNGDSNAVKILGKLAALRGRGIRETIVQLLNPADNPSPTCLIHTDFWTDNIFFRTPDPSMDLLDQSNDFCFNSRSDIKNEAERAVADILLKTANRSYSHQSELIDQDELILDCKILDWQMMSIGKPTHDIALLLITSLTTEVRREHEKMLLEYYYKCFKNIVGKFDLNINFDLECLQNEYKSSSLFAVFQIIASSDLVLNEETTQERLLAALIEIVDMKLI